MTIKKNNEVFKKTILCEYNILLNNYCVIYKYKELAI